MSKTFPFNRNSVKVLSDFCTSLISIYVFEMRCQTKLNDKDLFVCYIAEGKRS